MTTIQDKTNLENFKYNVRQSKSENCVLIDTKKWIYDKNTLIRGYYKDGTVKANFITKVLETNINKKEFPIDVNKGDTILLSRQAVNLAKRSSYELYKQPSKYANVHVQNILGVFEDGKQSASSLTLFPNKVLMRKIEVPENDFIVVNYENPTFVGEVINTGSFRLNSKLQKEDMFVEKGDKVLCTDAVATEVLLDNETYYLIHDTSVAGKFNTKLDMEDFTPYGAQVILEEEQENTIEGHSSLYNPVVDLEEDDITEVYRSDRYKVLAVGSNVEQLKKDNLVYVNRDITNYVTFKGTRYYILENEYSGLAYAQD